MDNNRINKKVFLFDKDRCKDNWSASFKAALTDIGLEGHLINNSEIPIDQIKIGARDKLTRDWRHHCATKDKLRTYRTFKNDMCTAPHLSCNLPKYERSLISQLRLGVLPLCIETGRFVGLNEQDRTCMLCNNGQIENEAHFLFGCEMYNDYRNDLETSIGSSFDNLNLTEKFELVFKHPHSLGRYLRMAMNVRKNKLYNN